MNPTDGVTNYKQIWNLKNNMKKKEFGSSGNIADDIVTMGLKYTFDKSKFVKACQYEEGEELPWICLLYTSPSPRD